MSGSSPSTASGESLADESSALPPGPDASHRVGGNDCVAAFVRTPFEVRRNVVKVWRPLPRHLWTALVRPEDVASSKHRERQAILAVGLMAVVLVCGVSGLGYRTAGASVFAEFPVLGGVIPVGSGSVSPPGWYFAPKRMLPATLWVVGPPLVGWVFVRAIWIPLSAASGARAATMALARNLSGTYLYVYLMITAGAVLLPLLVLIGAERTSTFRWCLWCFLFGESFFVPAVMWSRLVVNDSAGAVFGSRRYWLLSAYVLLFVIIPIIGMALENSRAG